MGSDGLHIPLPSPRPLGGSHVLEDEGIADATAISFAFLSPLLASSLLHSACDGHVHPLTRAQRSCCGGFALSHFSTFPAAFDVDTAQMDKGTGVLSFTA